MEDGDEFGDLYTDVLYTFHSPVSAEQPLPSAASLRSSISLEDLPRKEHHEEEACEVPDPSLSSSSYYANQSFVAGPPASSCESGRNLGDVNKLIDKVEKNDDLAVVFEIWAPDSPKKTETMVTENGDKERNEAREDGDKPCINVVKDEGDDRGEIPEKVSDGCDDVQDGDTGIEVSEILIQEAADGVENGAHMNYPPREDASAEGDDWDSDSEDDLQIVLNDNAQGPLTMDGVDDGDEDGEPLVVADDDPNHQQIEEQEWGDDAAQSTDPERKDVCEAGKVNGEPATALKIGYASHGYHSFHSQFKYVRYGVGPLPGTVSGGPAGGAISVHPPVSTVRGRGNWRPTGNKAAPSMQEKFQSGYGMPRSSDVQGRGFSGGLEFTLPSHKTIFEVAIDDFNEKPWKLPGIDISDFFNFGLNEAGWKDYCKQLEQLRLEAAMQSKIRVYESGRMQHDYDPDLPPELAAAAGIHQNANTVKQDIGQGDLASESSRVRPPLPTGRPIPVEIGCADRLPSIDTRPPRIRDSDAIIEIVLQESVDDDPCAGNDISEQPANDTQREDFIAVQDQNAHADPEYNDESSLAANRRKGELAAKKVPSMNAAHNDRPEGNGDDPGIVNEERPTNGKARGGSPLKSHSRSSLDKRCPDKENEVSVESIDGKHSLPLPSLITEQRDDRRINETYENINTHLEKVEMNSETVDASNTFKGEDLLHPVKKQKPSSRANQPVLLEKAGADDAKATNSEDIKSKLESNTRLDAKEEQAAGDRHSTHVGSAERQLVAYESNARRNEQNVKQENERHHMAVKGREESHSKPTHPHSRRIRAEDATKWEHGHEMGSRHKGKLQESERSDAVEHSRKPVGSSSSRGHRKERNDGSKNLCDNTSDPHNKRKNDEEFSRDGGDKEEALHGHRESTNCRKRERVEITDQRKKGDQIRLGDRFVRYKDDGRFQREKRDRESDEWLRAKQSNVANLSRHEREEGQGGVRSARGAEEKGWCGTHARAKDDFSVSDKDNSMKGTGRHSDQHKKGDMHACGSQFSCEDRRSRQERLITRDDRVDNRRTQEKKCKDSTQKRKETKSGGQNSSVHTQSGREANHVMKRLSIGSLIGPADRLLVYCRRNQKLQRKKGRRRMKKKRERQSLGGSPGSSRPSLRPHFLNRIFSLLSPQPQPQPQPPFITASPIERASPNIFHFIP